MSIKAYKQLVILELLDLAIFAAVPFALIKLSSLNLLNSVALGLSIGYFVTYFINIFAVKHTIFLEKFNNPEVKLD